MLRAVLGLLPEGSIAVTQLDELQADYASVKKGDVPPITPAGRIAVVNQPSSSVRAAEASSKREEAGPTITSTSTSGSGRSRGSRLVVGQAAVDDTIDEMGCPPPPSEQGDGPTSTPRRRSSREARAPRSAASTVSSSGSGRRRRSVQPPLVQPQPQAELAEALPAASSRASRLLPSPMSSGPARILTTRESPPRSQQRKWLAREVAVAESGPEGEVFVGPEGDIVAQPVEKSKRQLAAEEAADERSVSSPAYKPPKKEKRIRAV